MDNDVQKLLAGARLGEFEPQLLEFGVEEVTEADMTDMGMNKLQQRRYLSVLMPAVRDVVTGRGSRLLSNPPPSSSPSLSHPVGLGAPGSATVPGFEVGTAEDDVDSSFSTAPREALTPGQSPGLSPNRAAMLALMHGSQPTGVLPRTLQFRSPQMHGTPAAGDTSAPPAVPPPLDTHPSLGNPPPPAVPQGATKPLSPAKARTRHLRVQTGAADAGDAGDGGDAAQPTLPDPEIMHRADDGHGNSDGAGGDRDGDGNGDDAGNDDDGGGDGDVSVAGSSESSDPLAAVDMALRVGDDMPPLLSSAFGTAQATVADTANAVAVATASGSPLLVSVPKWKEVEAPDGYLYYYNTDTNKTQWEVPDADYYSVDGKLVRSKDAVRSLLPDMDTVNKRAQELDASAVTTSPYLSQHRSPKAHARAAANRGTAASGSTGGYLAAHIKDASGQQGKATTPARKRTKAGARGTRGKRGTRGTRGASRGSAARGTPTDERSRGATARGKKVKSGGRGANRRRGARAKSPSATGAGGEEPSRWRSTWQQVMGHGGGGGGGGGGGSGKAKKKARGRRHSSPRQPPGVAASAAAPVVSVAVPSRAAPRLPTRVAPTVLKGGYSGSSPVVPSTPSPHASPRAPKSFWSDGLRDDLYEPTDVGPVETSRQAYKQLLRGQAATGQQRRGSRASTSSSRRKSKSPRPSVFDRLTDVRSFTGTHRQRFDRNSGAGLGLTGRERTELDLDDVVKEVTSVPLALPVEGGAFTPKSNRYFHF